MSRRIADIIGQVPLFTGLSKRHLKRLADMAKQQRFQEGDALAKEGEPGDTSYILLEGQSEVRRKGQRVADLMPGDFFGEISLLDGGPRTATVVASTPIEVLALRQKPFQSLLEREPSIVLKMLEELARRLRTVERPLTG